MKIWCLGGAGVRLHTFLIFALDGGEWLISWPCSFTPLGKNSRYPFNSRLGVLWSWFRGFDGEKNLMLLQGMKPHITQLIV
jgi:hypothetical protein